MIFETGRELLDAVRTRPTGSITTLRVGVADVMAKLVTFQLLLPATHADEPVRLVCREDHPRQLFAALAVHDLDLLLADVPLSPGLDVKACSHVLGESTASWFAAPQLAKTLRRGFPASLNGAPFLMPTRDTAMRGTLESWFDAHSIRPVVAGEFDDSALLKVFGQEGVGVFPAPTAVADRVCSQYRVRVLGELERTREVFYAISPERRVKHPAVTRIIEHAKARLFSSS
ncbi:MAG: LysR substrate-binding domain-containing protein [Planctomycetota bacterium]